MWVIDEMVDGESLVDIINTRHENVKHLPRFPLPESVLAVADLIEVTNTCDYLVLVIPHQFLKHTLDGMSCHVCPGTVAISLIKELTFLDDHIELVSDSNQPGI
jgi:glycerol-3-phosphate dehydrogenase (NAD+)